MLQSELKTRLNPDLIPLATPLRHQKLTKNSKKSTFPMCHQNSKMDPKKAKYDPKRTFLGPEGPRWGSRRCPPAPGPRQKQSWGQFRLLGSELKTRLNQDLTPPGGPLGAAKCYKNMKNDFSSVPPKLQKITPKKCDLIQR